MAWMSQISRVVKLSASPDTYCFICTDLCWHAGAELRKKTLQMLWRVRNRSLTAEIVKKNLVLVKQKQALEATNLNGRPILHLDHCPVPLVVFLRWDVHCTVQALLEGKSYSKTLLRTTYCKVFQGNAIIHDLESTVEILHVVEQVVQLIPWFICPGVF